MNNKQRLIMLFKSCSLLGINAEEGKTYAKTKDYIQYCLYLLQTIGLPLELEYVELKGKPVAVELAKILRSHCPYDKADVARYSFKRPYSGYVRSVKSIITACPYENFRDSDVSELKWAELLATILMVHKKTQRPLNNPFYWADMLQNFDMAVLTGALQAIQKLLDESRKTEYYPSISGMVKYLDLADEDPVVHTGVLFEDGYILDGINYIPFGEYQLLNEP